MLLLVLCFALSTLAVQCRGSQHSSCAAGQCKVVRGVEVCTRCRAGHVLVNGVCTGNSAGYEADSDCQVDNCARCAQGKPAECEECNPNFDLDNGTKQCVSSSINKSSGGLSTGAIAGIAVAVVIVVGGLVGFLCWWFLCRGKA
ncbi:Variant-specific surface protein VSP4A1 precursor [Giardia lamblia P15]|uniref:Variant-specific surface protein VSP4A1 n=1 Tax=Giardia intestinalis (strain P15) TaxID=658858 RepID=E1F4L5_GIAIA|nr:Variant-specific surface protein VSP4A1 precursor [Giardia lamblia P15]